MNQILRLSVLIGIFTIFGTLNAQEAPITPTIIGTGVYHGLTPPLKDLPTLTEGEFQLMLIEAKIKSWNQELQNRSYPYAE